MLEILFWVLFALYFLGKIICGFYNKMLEKVSEINVWFKEYAWFCDVLYDIAEIPFFIGEFIAWLLIKMSDLFNKFTKLF